MPGEESDFPKDLVKLVEEAVEGILRFIGAYLRTFGETFRGPLRAAIAGRDRKDLVGPYTFLVVSVFIASKVRETPFVFGRSGQFLVRLFRGFQEFVSAPSLELALAKSVLILLSVLLGGWMLTRDLASFEDGENRSEISRCIAYLYGVQIPLLMMLPLLASVLAQFLVMGVVAVTVLILGFLALGCPTVRLYRDLVAGRRVGSVSTKVNLVLSLIVASLLGIVSFSFVGALVGDEELNGSLSNLSGESCALVIRNPTKKFVAIRSLGNLTLMSPSVVGRRGGYLKSVDFDILSAEGRIDPVVLEKDSMKTLPLRFRQKVPYEQLPAKFRALVTLGTLAGMDERPEPVQLECQIENGGGVCELAHES